MKKTLVQRIDFTTVIHIFLKKKMQIINKYFRNCNYYNISQIMRIQTNFFLQENVIDLESTKNL